MADIIQLKENGVIQYTKAHAKGIDGIDGVLVKASGNENIAGNKNFTGAITLNSKRLLTEDDLISTTPIWEGATFMSGTQTVTLSKSLKDCSLGIIVKFNPYNSTAGTAYTSQSSYWLIPKQHVLGASSGQNTFCPIFKQDGTLVGAKVLTVSPTVIKGADVNAVGALYGYVMTGVYPA